MTPMLISLVDFLGSLFFVIVYGNSMWLEVKAMEITTTKIAQNILRALFAQLVSNSGLYNLLQRSSNVVFQKMASVIRLRT